jgi:hypothetical protein
MSISSAEPSSSAALIRSYTSSSLSTVTTTPDSPDGPPPPSYTSLFPVQTTTTMTEPTDLMRTRSHSRRYTTITYREIRFPSGCPCHAKNARAAYEAERKERIAISRANSDYALHARPVLVQRADSAGSSTSDLSEASSSTSSSRRSSALQLTTTTTNESVGRESLSAKVRSSRPFSFLRRTSGLR